MHLSLGCPCRLIGNFRIGRRGGGPIVSDDRTQLVRPRFRLICPFCYVHVIRTARIRFRSAWGIGIYRANVSICLVLLPRLVPGLQGHCLLPPRLHSLLPLLCFIPSICCFIRPFVHCASTRWRFSPPSCGACVRACPGRACANTLPVFLRITVNGSHHHCSQMHLAPIVSSFSFKRTLIVLYGS